MPTPRARLLTIRFSHYCEKARWALERAGVPFDEESHAPIFHMPFVKRAGGQRATPVLVWDGRVIDDSTAILKAVHARVPEAGLYPEALADEVLAVEEELDEALGPAARRVAYDHVLPSRAATLALFRLAESSAPLRASLPVTRPLLASGIRAALKIDPPGVARSRAKLEQVLATTGERLARAEAEGRRYLVGDRFTAADLTLAALLVPVAMPERCGVAEDEVPRGLRELADQVRASPAGAHAARMYSEERHISV
jgi:glutathione S-transferase